MVLSPPCSSSRQSSLSLYLSRKHRRYALAVARRRTALSWLRGLFALAFITLAVLGTSAVHAAPTLTLGTSDSTLHVTVPQGGGTATATTTITTGTFNTSGYALTAELAATEPGIGIGLKGGDITSNTPLTAGSTPLGLKTTTAATTGDTTQLTLTFTIDGTVTPGTRQLSLTYQATDNTPAAPTTMQAMTKSYCTTTMTTYDGTNNGAVLTLADTRGGTTQHYHVAKLADGNCWMLDNLKLGSTTAATTLTPADSNVATNFTLPQLNDGTRTMDLSTDPGNDYDTPYAYGPIPGDTGTDATNYGYLYNFSAATAGETRTSLPGNGTNGDIAPYSICAAGWKLPSAGTSPTTSDFGKLDITYGGTGLYTPGSPSAPHWQANGAFKGVLSGYWAGGFGNQGAYGYWWSSSAGVGYPSNAHYVAVDGAEVGPGDNVIDRLAGMGLRCLLQ